MLVLVSYDIAVSSEGGQSRLRKVAKICTDYGQRVQNSVFECSLTPAQFIIIKNELKQVIDFENDNLRFYHLGKNWQKRVEIMGKQTSYDPEKDSFVF